MLYISQHLAPPQKTNKNKTTATIYSLLMLFQTRKDMICNQTKQFLDTITLLKIYFWCLEQHESE